MAGCTSAIHSFPSGSNPPPDEVERVVQEAVVQGTALVDADASCSADDRSGWSTWVLVANTHLFPTFRILASTTTAPTVAEVAELEKHEVAYVATLTTHPSFPPDLFDWPHTLVPGSKLQDGAWESLARRHRAVLIRAHNAFSELGVTTAKAVQDPNGSVDPVAVGQQVRAYCSAVEAVDPLGGDASLRDAVLAECATYAWMVEEVLPLRRRVITGEARRADRRRLKGLEVRLEELRTREKAMFEAKQTFEARWRLATPEDG